MSTQSTDGRANRAAAMWLVNVSVAFTAIYWLTNQLTSMRTDIGELVFEWERAISVR